MGGVTRPADCWKGGSSQLLVGDLELMCGVGEGSVLLLFYWRLWPLPRRGKTWGLSQCQQEGGRCVVWTLNICVEKRSAAQMC